MREQPPGPRTHKGGIPCRISLPDSGADGGIHAEAIQLDRRGGVLHFVAPGVPPGLRTQRDVVVSFHLPANRGIEPRRLCFLAGVCHVSASLAPHHWIGVSFQKAAFCGAGECFPGSDDLPAYKDS